jgi:hypothetical protein
MTWKRLLIISTSIIGIYKLRNRINKFLAQSDPLPMLIRLSLPFPKPLIFTGFLPETKADGLHLRLNEGRYIATIYMSDRKTQSANISDIPGSPEELKLYVELFCRGLTMEIEVKQIDPEILVALEDKRITEKTEEFGRELSQVVISVYNSLIDYFRNIAKEYWLEPLMLSPYSWQSPQGYFNHWQAIWRNTTGTWQRLLIGKNVNYGVTTLANENEYVDKDKWLNAASFIEAGKQAPMVTVLLANSLQHLDQLNGRLAVVEAVAAIDAYIGFYLPKLLLRLPEAAKTLTKQIREAQELLEDTAIEEGHIAKFVEGKGLRGTVDEVFKIIMTEVGLVPEDVKNVREAINERNLVLHSSKRKVDISKARNYVSAIDRVLMTFRQVIIATK